MLPVATVQIRPRTPPIKKHIVINRKGGVGAEPTESKASRPHRAIAIKPRLVAF